MTIDGHTLLDTDDDGRSMSRRDWLKAAMIGGWFLATRRGVLASPPASSSRDKAYREWLSAVTDSIAAPPGFDGTGVRIHFAVADIDPDKLISQKLFESVQLGPLAHGQGELKRVSYQFVENLDRTVFYDLITSKPQAFRVGEEKSSTMLVIPVLEGHQTEVAIYRDSDGWLHVSFYAPEAGTDRDRKALRALGEAQNHLVSRSAEAARTEIDRLLNSGCVDPVALCLSAYLASIEGDTGRLAKAAEAMARYDFPDRYVALANLAEDDKESRETVEKYYHKALAAGLPMLRPYLDILWQGTEGMSLDADPFGQRLREAGSRQVQNQLWSAWRPDAA
jgi:hypothetical protein